jgi:RND family efflux transporter MFP subunit
VALVVAAGCSAHGRKARFVEGERLPRLEAVAPAKTTLEVRAELLATVEPLEKADLSARVPGVVEFLPPDVDIGRPVKAGEKLLALAVPDLEADRASKEALLDQARNQKRLAVESRVVAGKEVEEAREQEKRYQAECAYRRDQHQRTTQLVSRSALQPEKSQETLNQLEAAEAAWRAARVQTETKQAKLAALAVELDVAESRIKVAQTEVQRLQTLINYATVHAPFDGVVTKRWVDRGATVKDASAPLLTVMNTSTVRVLLDIPERYVPLVNAKEQNPNPDGQGDPVLLHFASLRDVIPGGELRGHVTRLASALDATTRTMRAEVHLDNRAGYLRPNMSGQAAVYLERRPDRLVIPSTALTRRAGEVAVLYVEEQGLSGDPPRGVVRAARVELGLDDGQQVEIRSGLPDGIRVLARSSSVLREGDTVIPVPLQEREP